MRPISTLTKLSDYAIDRAKLRQGFLGLYDKKIGTGRNGLIDIYFALVAGCVCTEFRASWFKPAYGMENLKSILDTGAHMASYSVLSKNNKDKTVEYRTILASFPANNMSPWLWSPAAINDTFFKMQSQLSPEQLANIESCHLLENTPIGRGPISGKEVAATFNLTPRAAELLGRCLKQMEAVPSAGGMVDLWATWTIDAQEAQYLTNSTFTELRLSDIYPTLMVWVGSVFGRNAATPKNITKVSRIAQDVKEAYADSSPQPRVGIDNLVADIDGGLYLIPQVDRSGEYEQKLMDYGLQDDGSYTWNQKQDLDEGTDIKIDSGPVTDVVPKRKLPKNMPIFSDWLNDKFSYSNTNGNLSVYDLSDTVPVSEYHLSLLLKQPILNFGEKRGPGAILALLLNSGQILDGNLGQEGPTREDFGDEPQVFELLANQRAAIDNEKSVKNKVGVAINRYEAYTAARTHLGLSNEELPLQQDLTFAHLSPGTPISLFKFVGRLIERTFNLIATNQEVVYQRLSVMTTLQLVAYGDILTKYGQRYDEIRNADLKKREVYLHQGVDPNYEQTGTPYVKEGLAFQPHQAKNDNQMRGSPDFAMYDVDAGGGKTISILTNLMNELKRGKCRRPIVACPSTLVSQYVEEVVYVTQGRMNIIPITNATMRQHGEERLTMMLMKAPINTVVVTDFDFVKGRGRQVSYGNKTTNVFTNAEWLRQFQFDLIAVDEVHKLANLKSARREGMARLMQDIPKKRLASGTFVNNTITDLVSQIALFDPTIFGGREAFLKEYAQDTSGEKVLAWKSGAEKKIRDKIKEHVVVASARRKEWAALLPPKEERFRGCELTDNQRLLYDSILKETTDLIEEAMAKDPDLKEAMESEDDSIAENLEGMLRPYLVRLERFLSAPAEDELAPMFLKDPVDQVSPKVNKIYQIIREHLAANIPGKIIVFTNFLPSAEAVFKYAPPELKDKMIHYTAGAKMECRSEFSRNPKKVVMVGASASMDTGINFQDASRLIRMETVWTPGLVEQGNARINRPQLKKVEARNAVYFDWLVVNRTIDVTKIARLVAKMVSKAKFDEADTPSYQEIPNLPVISMNIDSIRSQNDFNEELVPYLETYQTYQQVEQAEYKRYREQNAATLHPVAVKTAPMLKDSKLMSRVPYVPGMTIYASDQLGLVRYDEFVHADLSTMEAEDTEAEDGDGPDPDDAADNPKAAFIRKMKARWAKEVELTKDMPVHTEWGDGVIFGARRKVWVQLNDGRKMRIPKLQVFVITRTTTNSKDMRTEILKAVGNLPLTTPIEVPVETGTQTDKIRKGGKPPVAVPTKPVKPVKTEETIGAAFNFVVLDDMLAIVMDGTDNPRAVTTVQNFGFRMSPEYMMTRLIGPVRLFDWLTAVSKKGFKLTPDASNELRRLWSQMKAQGRSIQSAPGFATQSKIRNFVREIVKPVADPQLLNLYSRISNGRLFLIMPIKGHPATAKAIKVPSTDIKWHRGGGEAEMLRFCKNKAEALQVMKDIKSSGVTILNEKALALAYSKLQFKAPKPVKK